MVTQRQRNRAVVSLVLLAIMSGCSVYRNTVPAYLIGPGTPMGAREDREAINFLRLRQDPPDAYRLDSRDVLGIYIEGVLGNKEEPPPVHFPETGDLPPAVGYPVPVREDGTISLPLVPAVEIRGLTLTEAEQKIRSEYIERKILKQDRDRIIVTLMRPRTYHVLVVREDTANIVPNGSNPQQLAQTLAFGTQRRGLTQAVELRAYENDVLHALSETGGLPGMDALNEVIILRRAFNSPNERDQYMHTLNDPTTYSQLLSGPNVVRIPLRLGPCDGQLNFSERDIVLQNGDIVFVQSRETEVYYTGGLLDGGQFPLPRDYDIDVLEAMAMAGGKITSGTGGSDDTFGRGNGIGALFPATRVIVLREVGGEQIPIEVNLKRAMVDPQERITVLPGDFIVLEYKPIELIGNVLINTFRLNYFLNN